MVQTLETALRPITTAGAEAALLGLLAAGCRLIFTSSAAGSCCGDSLRRTGRSTRALGGALIQVQSDHAATAMAAGGALRGARAAAVVADSQAADLALVGLDDLPVAIIDVSGRLPLTLSHVRVLMSPCIPQGAYEAGRGLFTQLDALHGPGLIAGLTPASGQVKPHLATTPEEAWPVPIHHHGPDDPDLLILGSGPGFEACEAAREQLEEEGIAAAHLHLMQVSPFPGAILAPAITSARRVLVVEPGGPGHLAAYIRSNLGAPAEPFGELPRLGATPLGPDDIAHRAREVMAL